MSRWPILAGAALTLLLRLAWPAPSPALDWWTTHALEKIRPSDRQPENPARTVKINAARNEFEPFQIALRSEDGDIDDVDVTVSDLTDGNATIGAEKFISVYLEKFLNLTVPSSVAGGTGEWPDPLIPRVDRYSRERRNAFPFKLRSGHTQPIWVDVFVPPAASPGTYRGQIRVSTPGKSSFEIPVELNVWSFDLPSTSSLPTTFGFSGTSALRAHYGRYTNDGDLYALTRLYQRAALAHRITLDTSAAIVPSVTLAGGHVQVRWDRYDSFIQPLVEGQLFDPGEPLYGAQGTSVALHTPQLLKTPEQQVEFWKETAQHFRQKRWLNRLFHYLWDEPKPEDGPALLQLGRAVHSADPDLKNLLTSPLHANWREVVDIWTPVINCFERKPHESDYCKPMAARSDYEPELKNGKQLWWYQACSSHGCFIVGGDYFRGWPSYMIDDAPVRNRIMEWLTWKYGIQGELYFATNEAYARKRDPWSDVHLFGGNGDGTLFYPGRPELIGGTAQIPIESIRLKLIREGLEDYEYLKLFSKVAGAEAARGIVDAFVRNTYDFSQDPQRLYAAREEMGRQISAMR